MATFCSLIILEFYDEYQLKTLYVVLTLCPVEVCCCIIHPKRNSPLWSSFTFRLLIYSPFRKKKTLCGAGSSKNPFANESSVWQVNFSRPEVGTDSVFILQSGCEQNKGGLGVLIWMLGYLWPGGCSGFFALLKWEWVEKMINCMRLELLSGSFPGWCPVSILRHCQSSPDRTYHKTIIWPGPATSQEDLWFRKSGNHRRVPSKGHLSSGD